MTALRLALAAVIATTCVLPACTDGTTPECADAQCAPLAPPDAGGGEAASPSDASSQHGD